MKKILLSIGISLCLGHSFNIFSMNNGQQGSENNQTKVFLENVTSSLGPENKKIVGEIKELYKEAEKMLPEGGLQKVLENIPKELPHFQVDFNSPNVQKLIEESIPKLIDKLKGDVPGFVDEFGNISAKQITNVGGIMNPRNWTREIGEKGVV
jgi:hypothetical protein